MAACQQLRKNAVAGLDGLLSLAAGPLRAGLVLGGGGAAGLLAASCYCSAHACQGDGGRCGERVAEVGGGSFCGGHECSRRGCAREGVNLPRRRGGGGGGRGGLCDRHYKKRKGKGGGGGGGGGCPPVGAFGPMGMGMPMGLPPFFGGQVYDSSDYSDSDSDDGRRPRGLPFGGMFP